MLTICSVVFISDKVVGITIWTFMNHHLVSKPAPKVGPKKKSENKIYLFSCVYASDSGIFVRTKSWLNTSLRLQTPALLRPECPSPVDSSSAPATTRPFTCGTSSPRSMWATSAVTIIESRRFVITGFEGFFDLVWQALQSTKIKIWTEKQNKFHLRDNISDKSSTVNTKTKILFSSQTLIQEWAYFPCPRNISNFLGHLKSDFPTKKNRKLHFYITYT